MYSLFVAEKEVSMEKRKKELLKKMEDGWRRNSKHNKNGKDCCIFLFFPENFTPWPKAKRENILLATRNFILLILVTCKKKLYWTETRDQKNQLNSYALFLGILLMRILMADAWLAISNQSITLGFSVIQNTSRVQYTSTIESCYLHTMLQVRRY